jgi:hypothetical protein
MPQREYLPHRRQQTMGFSQSGAILWKRHTLFRRALPIGIGSILAG